MIQNGFINIDKDCGMTSASVVAILKRQLKAIGFDGKIGHLGTLDPDGEGVLPIALGRATRLFDYFNDKHKIYYTEFKFGLTTDTLDSSGTVLKTCKAIPTLQQIEVCIPKLCGLVAQVPPKYSAKVVDGERAYAMARRGEDFELKPKEVMIHSIKLLEQLDTDVFAFEIECGSGTYIRSIARDMAQCLGTLGIMKYIKRTASGAFTLHTAVKLDEFSINPTEHILPLEAAIGILPRLDVGYEVIKRLLDGLTVGAKAPDGQVAIYHDDKPALLARSLGNVLKAEVWFL